MADRLQDISSAQANLCHPSRHLCSRLSGAQQGSAPQHSLFDFLALMRYSGERLMLNERVEDAAGLERALRRAERLLQSMDDEVMRLDPLGGHSKRVTLL